MVVGSAFPLVCLLVSLLFWPWGCATWLIYPLQVLRQTTRNRGPIVERVLLALFQMVARFPEVWGQIKFMRDHLFGNHSRLIEYK